MSARAIKEAEYHSQTFASAGLVGGRIVATVVDPEEGFFGIVVQPKGSRSKAKQHIVWFSRDAEVNGPGAPVLQSAKA